MARVFALILGLIGVVVAFTINLLYSSLHVLGRVAGITNDQTHFLWGLFVVLIALVGSVLEAYLEASPYPNHGQRVVIGQRMMQAFSDIFLGWSTFGAGIIMGERAHDGSVSLVSG